MNYSHGKTVIWFYQLQYFIILIFLSIEERANIVSIITKLLRECANVNVCVRGRACVFRCF